MFKLISVITLTLILAINAAPSREKDIERAEDSIVTLQRGGQLRGEYKSLSVRRKYHSFKGIRYAQPPLKDLRFKSPVAYPDWSGVENATEHGGECVGPGYAFGTQGVEDCLFLNVYSPDTNPKEKYPVMVWLHGGSFTSGSGNSLIYGPKWLVEHDVIIVTVNYRLGLLGFMSTEDNNSPGNYGLKDIVQSLKWIQRNIEAFGGDANRVTIFGESAGGCLVHYLVLSKMAAGLFHSAIAQSGTALTPWAFQDAPKAAAFEFAKKINITAETTEELVKQLKAVEDVTIFAKNTPNLIQVEVPRGNAPFLFAPTVEPKDTEEEPFLTENPLTIMQEGTFNKVPFIVGSTNTEALFVVRESSIDPDIFDKLNNNTNLLLPYEWHVTPNSLDAQDIIKHIKDMYFEGKPIENMLDYVKYSTDRQFEYAAYKTAMLHSSKQSTYYYIFSFDGALNYIKKLLLLNSYDGAMHADDLGYLWQMLGAPSPILPGSSSAKVKARMMRMWTDFAKTHDPTPVVDELITTKWPKVEGEQEFMDIGKDLVADKQPFGERMLMWYDLDKKYN